MATTDAATDCRELDGIRERATSDLGPMASFSDKQFVELQRRWTRALSARLDQTLEDADRPIADAVAAAWRELAEEQAPLRRVLDAAEPRCPALRVAMSAEFRLLALAAGVVCVDAPIQRAVRVGQAYRRLIRSGIPFHSPHPVGLVGAGDHVVRALGRSG